MNEYFTKINKIKYEGVDNKNDLAFRYYDANKILNGKSMEQHLRFAACYWHTFCWNGSDAFGSQTLTRPWLESGDSIKQAELKMDVAFEFFEKLTAPYYCFHDRDVSPEGKTLTETVYNFERLAERLLQKQEQTGVKLLWGTANLFSHKRFMSGAASNPNPEVMAFAAAQVRQAMDVTNMLRGENYVLWGGREGYDTILNTDLKRESAQMGRFLNMVVEHKHKIGFKGDILIEPKPQEPTKHQYDYDCQSVHAFLYQNGLENEIKLNIEANHATLAGHSFEHELTYATENNIFGSVDMNRGDMQNGWDTDQFPNNVPDITLALYVIFNAGGFNKGGINFDSKIRRQSIDNEDLFHGHIGAMDVCARGLINATKMIEDGRLQAAKNERYAEWDNELGKNIMNGNLSLEQLADKAIDKNIDPKPISGRQEALENLINRFC